MMVYLNGGMVDTFEIAEGASYGVTLINTASP